MEVTFFLLVYFLFEENGLKEYSFLQVYAVDVITHNLKIILVVIDSSLFIHIKAAAIAMEVDGRLSRLRGII